jgi:phage baseplate assembly protein gpV
VLACTACDQHTRVSHAARRARQRCALMQSKWEKVRALKAGQSRVVVCRRRAAGVYCCS